jgi:O-acetyl-ADP-ribose deacetylase (regulator of RNase III)
VTPHNEAALRNCYINALNLMLDLKLRSIAFPCISTGVYNYPSGPAARLAIETICNWLAEDATRMQAVDSIQICTHARNDENLYKDLKEKVQK